MVQQIKPQQKALANKFMYECIVARVSLTIKAKILFLVQQYKGMVFELDNSNE